jgi:hypothetical protein
MMQQWHAAAEACGDRAVLDESARELIWILLSWDRADETRHLDYRRACEFDEQMLPPFDPPNNRRRLLSFPPGILQAGRKLILNFPLDSLRQIVAMVREESTYLTPIFLRQFAKRPRQGFDHHIFVVGCRHAADLNNLAHIFIRTAPAQRDGTDQCGAPPPMVGALRPVVNDRLRKPAIPPGRS